MLVSKVRGEKKKEEKRNTIFYLGALSETLQFVAWTFQRGVGVKSRRKK